MNSALKNLIVAASAGFVIVAAAAFAVTPAMATGYDVGIVGKVVGVEQWDTLNVRLWPASYSQKIGELAPDTLVYVERCIKVEYSSDWCKVGRDTTYGWVNSRYLVPAQ